MPRRRIAASAFALVVAFAAACSDATPQQLGAQGGGDAGTTSDAADAGVGSAAIDDFFAAQMKAAEIPGVAVAIVKNGRIGWSHGYGQADIAAARAATPDTLFMLASVSKPVMAVALMHLVEDPAQHLSLDDAIDASLPFQVRNPSHPTTPITFRMLLTHTSSLIDGSVIQNETFVQGDATTSLHDWLQSYVARADSWSAALPGKRFAYSNAGASLAGYLVEAISGMNLQDYSAQAIFTPLAMTETSWFQRTLDLTHVAMPYEYTGGTFVPQGQYGFPDYPDGQLRTSATQLARFLMMFAQGGQYGGARVLKQATVDEMRRPQLPAPNDDQAIIWSYAYDENTRVLGHAGTYYGVSTDMWFDPLTSAGYVLLANGGTYFDNKNNSPQVAAMNEMNFKLMSLALSLP